MSGALSCESCGNSSACKLKDDGFTDLCPLNKPKRLVKTKQKSKQLDLNKSNSTKKIKKSKKQKERELEKRRILKDIEKGRGGPDIAGLKRMQGTLIDSKLVTKAKERLSNSF
jgi:hypothetical protein